MSAPAKNDAVSTLGRGRPSAAATRAKKAEVLRIARDHFVRLGYSSVTMDQIAAAGGITKRSLYQWHTDKAALFRACIMTGAERFPLPDIDPYTNVETALVNFATALSRELASDYALGMSMLLLRERNEFPEFAGIVRQVYEEFLIQPLASYLRERQLEHAHSDEMARLFATMILTPVYQHMLTGGPLPTPVMLEKYAGMAVKMFLAGNSSC